MQYCKDITLTEAEQVDVVKGNIRLIFRLKNVFQKTEALLFAPENKDALLEYAAQRRFTYHDNEIKFLQLGKYYPDEVEKYLFQYGQNISLTENEQFGIVKNNIRLIIVLKNIFAKTETLLFEAGNTQFLSMPKIGMGWGEYTRYAQGKEYKADTRNYYYGINNELRHDVDMGIVTLEPVVEFNVLGFYQNRTKENIRVEILDGYYKGDRYIVNSEDFYKVVNRTE